MDNRFKTEEEIAHAISSFTGLKSNPGWKLIEEIIDDNIKVYCEKLEKGSGKKETKEDIDNIREKLGIIRWMRNIPSDMVEKLQSPEGYEPENDPYLTTDQLEESKQETT